MTSNIDALLEQARKVWPIVWSVENGDLRGIYEQGGVDFEFVHYASGNWGLFAFGSYECDSPLLDSATVIAPDLLMTVIAALRDAWWAWWSQQEGNISDVEQQVLADSQGTAPVVWLHLQQIKQREADKHRVMVRVERRRIHDMKATILAIVRSFEAGEVSDLPLVINTLRPLVAEYLEEIAP